MTNTVKNYTLHPSDVIKHEKFLDVAIFVTSLNYVYSHAEHLVGFQIQGMWMNQGYDRSWFIGTENISLFISVEKLSEWSKAKESQASTCLRSCEWLPLTQL